MKRCLLLMLVFACSWNPAHAQSRGVMLDAQDKTLNIAVSGKPYAVYRYGKDLPKPFLEPLLAADGTVLTRSLIDPEDHPHHKGIWVSVDEVNGVKYWNEDGRIENVSVTPLGNGNPARFQVVNHWLAEDGTPTLTETTVVSAYSNRLLEYDITFSAGEKVVTFGDTKEGLFGFRMANWMREKETGKVVNSNGQQGTEECWGRMASWVDYHGKHGGKTYGLAIFDHPLNPRPSRYHVRNYGLFSINPFGERAYTKKVRPADPLILPPGGSVRLRYAMFPHDGDTATANVGGVYLDWLRGEL